jgi:hypothetical protein
MLYSWPLYVLAALWLLCRVQEDKNLYSLRTLVDITVVALAVSRYWGSIVPTSGHALFLTHSLMTIRCRFYRIPAAVMLIVTIAFKVSWGDYGSWVYGVLFGFLSGIIWHSTLTKFD